ncbi:hypothetical protein ACSBR2_018096 [Camellia fascicularis]
MASTGQQEKIGDDAPAGSRRPIDLDTEGDNHNAETRDQGQGKKDVGQTDDTPKKPDQNKYYNEDNLQI